MLLNLEILLHGQEPTYRYDLITEKANVAADYVSTNLENLIMSLNQGKSLFRVVLEVYSNEKLSSYPAKKGEI